MPTRTTNRGCAAATIFSASGLSDTHVEAIRETVDILIALNKESIDLHRREMAKGGVIIYDGEKLPGLAGNNLINVPFRSWQKKKPAMC